MVKKITIMVASDYPITRMGIARWLRKQPDMEIIGQASNHQDALKRAIDLKPDVIIVDVTTRSQNWPGAIASIKTCLPNVKVLVFSMLETEDELLEAERSGAWGHLPRNFTANQELAMIRNMAF
jgi:DNA-binding NarL/FixJ family response regulator